MASPKNLRHLTTTEAARLSGFSQQTIVRCFDNGSIKGYRIPESKFRRIPAKGLLLFVYGIEGYPADSKKRVWARLEAQGLLDEINEFNWREFDAAGMLEEISDSLRAKLTTKGILKPQQSEGGVTNDT